MAEKQHRDTCFTVHGQVCVQVCVQVCMTDQCAESLRWVSTGDAGGVDSDLHHLLHVGRWRLTGVKLPSRPRLRAAQGPTHVKLTPAQRRQEEQEEQEGEETEEEAEEEARHGGLTVRQTGSCSGGHISKSTPTFFTPQIQFCSAFLVVVLVTSWLLCGCHGYQVMVKTRSLQSAP